MWKGALVCVLREDVYPDIRREYGRLMALLEKLGCLEELQYLNDVHHGLPDFICRRSGEFKFIECKLQYEPLLDMSEIAEAQAISFQRIVSERFPSTKAKSDFAVDSKLL